MIPKVIQVQKILNKNISEAIGKDKKFTMLLASEPFSLPKEEHRGFNERYEKIKERVYFGLNEAVNITKKLWLWILFGVGIGAVIHNYIPSEVIQLIVSKGGFFAVPIAVILGVPMYGSCAAIIPIAVVLFEKGVPIGTALAFMMATAALSFPEAVILRRAMKLKLIAIFFGIVMLAIILTGYIYNLLQMILI